MDFIDQHRKTGLSVCLGFRSCVIQRDMANIAVAMGRDYREYLVCKGMERSARDLLWYFPRIYSRTTEQSIETSE
jgi:hypothetical protein